VVLTGVGTAQMAKEGQAPLTSYGSAKVTKIAARKLHL